MHLAYLRAITICMSIDNRTERRYWFTLANANHEKHDWNKKIEIHIQDENTDFSHP